MAVKTDNKQIPTIFNEIIRKRVADYIDKELAELIKKKVDSIITDTLAGLQLDSELFQDMYRHETQLLVRAVYKDEEIKQRGKP